MTETCTTACPNVVQELDEQMGRDLALLPSCNICLEIDFSLNGAGGLLYLTLDSFESVFNVCECRKGGDLISLLS